MKFTKNIILDNHYNQVHKKLFRDNYLVAIFFEFCVMGQCMIDGIICSRFMGSTGVAVQGILSPYFSIIGIISALLLLGTQKICVNAYCKGDQQRAEEAFSTSVFSALAIGSALIAICLIFADFIVNMFGATGEYAELHDNAKLYLLGLCLGAPFNILVPVITPIAQLSGHKRNIELSMIVILVSDFILDLLAGVSGIGMFGIGLASSISPFVGLLILAIPLMKNRKVAFRIKSVNSRVFCEVAFWGLPKATRRVCNVLRPIIFNRLVLALAGSMGMSVMSIRNGLSGIFESAGAALGSTVFVLAVLFVEENNIPALKRAKNKVYKFTVFPVAAIGILIIIFAELLLKLYGQSDPEMIAMAVPAVRFMAVDIVLFAILESLINYWQGIGETRVVNILIIFIRLIFPVLSVFALGNLIGTFGVWMSFPAASLISIMSFLIPSLIKYRKFALFPVPNDLTAQDHAEYECTVEDQSSISDLSAEIQKFCLENGIDKKRAFYVALCFEEMTNGIMTNYQSAKGKTKTVDFFLKIQGKDVSIRSFDNCKEFDAVSFYNEQTFDKDHPEKHLGIRIIMNASKDIRYRSMFGMNCLTIDI